MKNLFKAIRNKTSAVVNSIKAAVRSMGDNLLSLQTRTLLTLQDTRGDLATNTIGGIIVAVVIIGLLVVAINAFFPNFFTSMFNSMQTKLNANW